MQELQVHLKIISPLFMKGAKQEPEIRVPSIRGALRYWHRALIGGLTGGDLKQVRTWEGKVFGQAAGTGGQASAVVLWRGEEKTQKISSKEFQRQFSYLLFSLRKDERTAFNADSSFVLHLHLRPPIDDEELLSHAWASLWLLTHLGNLGYRSRRGWGGIQAIKANKQKNPRLTVNASSPSELKHELENGLKAIRKELGFEGKWPKLSKTPDFDVIHPKVCFIWVLEEAFQSWNAALTTIEEMLRSFRRSNGIRDRNLVTTIRKAAARGDTVSYPHEVALSYLGLPVPYFFKDTKVNAVLQAHQGTFKRRSSPLWIRLIQLSSGKVAVVFTWFHTRFLPQGVSLEVEVKGRGRGRVTDIRSPSLHGTARELRENLKAFLDDEYGLLEVSYG